MKRLNLIIGKKQIVIASLTVLLGAAAIINLAAGSGRKNALKNEAQTANTPSTAASANYGDTSFVSNQLSDSEAYFAKARLDKQQSRDAAAEVLAGMYQGGDMTQDELSVIQNNAKELSDRINSETKIETVLKAQGFADVLCYLSDKGANIIVKTNGLNAADAAKIKSALLCETDVANENITIVEVK